MRSFTVANDAQLARALARANPGSEIVLKDGTYSAPDLDGRRLDIDNLTLRAENPLEAQFLGETRLNEVSGITLDGIVFHAEQPKTGSLFWELATANALLITSAQDVTVTGSQFEGYVIDRDVIYPATPAHPETVVTPDRGLLGGQAIVLRGTEGVRIDGNEFTGLYHGVTFAPDSKGRFGPSVDTEITGNYFHAIRVDGIRGTDHIGTLVANNVMMDFEPFQIDPDDLRQNPKDHVDFIQFWASSNEKGDAHGVHDFSILNNVLIDRDGTAQAIFGHMNNLDDDARDGVSFTNFIIRDNLIVTGSLHGISLGSVQGGEISGNVILPNERALAGGTVPQLYLSSSERDNGGRSDDPDQIQYSRDLEIFDNITDDYWKNGIGFRSVDGEIFDELGLRRVDNDRGLKKVYKALEIVDDRGKPGFANTVYSTDPDDRNYVGGDKFYPGLADGKITLDDLADGPKGAPVLSADLIDRFDLDARSEDAPAKPKAAPASRPERPVDEPDPAPVAPDAAGDADVVTTHDGQPVPITTDSTIEGRDDANPRKVEVLIGSKGNDRILGYGGNDLIDGGDGDDYIAAGAGKDVFVRGGKGADIFEFGIGDEDIKIADWEADIDRIRLTGGLIADDLKFVQSFHAGTPLTQLQADADGDGRFDARLILTNVLVDELGPDDFVY